MVAGMAGIDPLAMLVRRGNSSVAHELAAADPAEAKAFR